MNENVRLFHHRRAASRRKSSLQKFARILADKYDRNDAKGTEGFDATALLDVEKIPLKCSFATSSTSVLNRVDQNGKPPSFIDNNENLSARKQPRQ